MTKTLTRILLCQKVADSIGVTQPHVGKWFNVLLDKISLTLAEGDNVKVSSFGSFLVRHKCARVGRNPKTGAAALISERRIVTFRASQRLRKVVPHITQQNNREVARAVI